MGNWMWWLLPLWVIAVILLLMFFKGASRNDKDWEE
jgi:hypothetical protein